MDFFAPGKTVRFSRLFNSTSGRMVSVAMDHGLGGLIEGLERPQWTIEQIIAGRPEAVILTPGMARRFAHLFCGKEAPSLILSLDFVLFHTRHGGSSVEEQGLMASVEEAMRLGADAIKLLLVMGRSDPGLQARNMSYLGQAAEACSHWGLPLIIEPTLWGNEIPPDAEVRRSVVADGTRIAVELGADMVKADYVEPHFEQIVASCPVPLTILGGGKAADAEAMLARSEEALAAGVAGLVFGRNVWQYAEPGKMIRALRALVHERDLQKALHEIKGD